MSTLTVVDLNHEEELTRSQMTRILGGHDVAKEKALVELYTVIQGMGAVETPDPPVHVPMKL